MNRKKKVENNEIRMGSGQGMTPSGRPIDDRLESPAQMAMQHIVRSMPDEMPSLAWRSSLNERLVAATAARRARQRRWLFGGSSFAGLALAATFALVVFLPKHAVPLPLSPAAKTSQVVASTTPSLEDQLLSSHNDSVTSQDVVGAGLTTQEVQSSDDDSGGQATS